MDLVKQSEGSIPVLLARRNTPERTSALAYFAEGKPEVTHRAVQQWQMSYYELSLKKT
jgi:hypothetical protein